MPSKIVANLDTRKTAGRRDTWRFEKMVKLDSSTQFVTHVGGGLFAGPAVL
jgi:hypothetical protein